MCSNTFDDPVEDRITIGQRAAPLIVAAIGLGAKKFAEDVAMCTVQFETIKSGFVGAYSGLHKIFGQLVHLFGR